MSLDLTAVVAAPQWVFDQLEHRADRPRFMVGDGAGGWSAVTWQAFADGIRDAAGWCASVGLEPGDRAAVFAGNRLQWAMAALGVQAAGGVLVPIYPASTEAQAGYVLEHAGAKIAFVDAATAPLVAQAAVANVASLEPAAPDGETSSRLEDAGHLPGTTPWRDVRSIGAAHHRAAASWFDDTLAALDLDQPALMLYTSGTTGHPKGVPLTHRNTQVNCRDWIAVIRPLLHPGEDVDLLWLPMSHIFGFGELCMGNVLGWTSWLSNPADALEHLPALSPTVFFSVPRYWEKLAAAASAKVRAEGSKASLRRDPAGVSAARQAALREVTGGRLRMCLSGGAGLDITIKDAFHDAGILIVEGYGLTETSPTLTINRPDDFRFDSVGKPLPTVELKLDGDGEILAKGPNVFGGYHADPEATRAAFTADGWFRTGDLGRFTPDGFLQIIGRKKEILVTAGGKNVPPANIELRFAGDPVIAQLVVYGDAKPYLVAAVWLQPDVAPQGREQAVQASIDAVNAQLGRWERVKRFAIIDAPMTVEGGLLTASLKLRRKQVYQRFAAIFEGLYEVAP